MTDDGIRAQVAPGTYFFKNIISVGSGGEDFDINDAGVVIAPSSGNNLFSTATGGVNPGSNNQPPPASLEDLFVSIAAGSEDLHLEPGGHNAIDNGLSLSGSFTVDIDNLARPYRAAWDIGADERLPYARFDTVNQDTYWYTDITYPTGGDSGSLAAGDYILNMYFDKLPAAATSVGVTVTVSRTGSGGTPATTIVSTSTTIDSATANPLTLNIGTGSAQTFDPGADERLQVRIHVDSITGGGSFALAYDTTADPTSLDTPSLTVPDPALILAFAAILVPIITALITERRKAATRLASLAVALLLALALMTSQVVPASAAPDSFYLHNVTLNDGRSMDTNVGAGGTTMTFGTTGQAAHWYSDLTYPTGGDDATLVAGAYTFNMSFSQLPRPWWDANYGYRQRVTISAGSAAVPADYTISATLDHAALVSGGKSQS